MHRRKRYPQQYSSTIKNSPSLLYDGKVVFAKRKKPDGWPIVALQVFGLMFAFWLLYILFFHTAALQFYVTLFYAHLGHDHAQHLVGQKYLQGYGIDANPEDAIFWFQQAAKNGHPHASYNLAVAHLQGLNASIGKEKAFELIQHAARSGVAEAQKTLELICNEDECPL